MTTPLIRSPAHTGEVSRRQVVFASAAAGLPLLGCGGAEALFAPFFVFSFQGVIGRQIVNISFTPDFASVDKPSGSFDTINSFINVRDPVNGNFFVSTNFSGSFNGRSLQITLAAPQAPLAVTYTAQFTEDDTVVLSPAGVGGTPITVRRNQNDSFLPMLTGDWAGSDAGGAAWRLRLDTVPVGGDNNATVLLAGNERLGAAAAVPLLGYASIYFIELNIARAGGSVRLTGTLNPSSAPVQTGVPQVTETISFAGGGSLRRV